MVRKVSGNEVQLDGETLRTMASAITKLNGLKELTAAFDTDDESGVRADLPEVLELKNSKDQVVGTVRRRVDGTWALSAVVAE